MCNKIPYSIIKFITNNSHTKFCKRCNKLICYATIVLINDKYTSKILFRNSITYTFNCIGQYDIRKI